MNETLERELKALSAEEKAEVIDLLLPDVVGNDNDDIAAELLTELERRDDAYEADPAKSMTLHEFDQKWFGKK
jgi:hypothetical protein